MPFIEWWARSNTLIPASLRKGLNAIISFTAWEIWKHRNSAIFDATRPSTQRLVDQIREEARLWARAGATGVANIIDTG